MSDFIKAVFWSLVILTVLVGSAIYEPLRRLYWNGRIAWLVCRYHAERAIERVRR